MLGTLHLFACWVLVIGNGLAGIWALTANRLAWLKTAWLWWFTGFVQLWVFVQLTIAALHLNASDGAPESFHVFRRERVKRVTSKEHPPAQRSPVAGRIPAKISEIDTAVEVDCAVHGAGV